GPRAAAEVAEDRPRPVEPDAGVTPRHPLVAEVEVGLRAASDDHLRVAQAKALADVQAADHDEARRGRAVVAAELARRHARDRSCGVPVAGHRGIIRQIESYSVAESTSSVATVPKTTICPVWISTPLSPGGTVTPSTRVPFALRAS